MQFFRTLVIKGETLRKELLANIATSPPFKISTRSTYTTRRSNTYVRVMSRDELEEMSNISDYNNISDMSKENPFCISNKMLELPDKRS